MSNPKECPSCKTSWNSEETIYEYFLKEYIDKGIPEYKTRDGFDTVETAARDSASMYGCTPETPKHFGTNVIGVEIQGMYDGVMYWECKKCGIHQHRFTGEIFPKCPKEHPRW